MHSSGNRCAQPGTYYQTQRFHFPCKQNHSSGAYISLSNRPYVDEQQTTVFIQNILICTSSFPVCHTSESSSSTFLQAKSNFFLLSKRALHKVQLFFVCACRLQSFFCPSHLCHFPKMFIDIKPRNQHLF